jgi:tRNA threonylcarbamoyladenosine biosynthesis protein TsaB
MRILAFDTATRATTVALASEGEPPLEARDDPAPGRRPNHVTRLLPLIEDVLAGSGTRWEELDRVAVGTGPGTFTGLRIGIATARALARAAEVPLVGVSTLESLALSAPADHNGIVLAVLDARRGEVFGAGWRAGELTITPRAVRPEALAEMAAGLGEPVLAIGDGAVEFRVILERSGASIPEDRSELHRVTAINHCRLARSLRGRGPDEVRPEYLRIPDAEIARRAACQK